MEVSMHLTRQPKSVYRYNSTSGWERIDAPIVTETTVALTVNGKNWLSFSCTPTNLDALAAGFLYNEGFIQTRDEIAIIEVCKQGASIDVWLKKSVERPDTWQ